MFYCYRIVYFSQESTTSVLAAQAWAHVDEHRARVRRNYDAISLGLADHTLYLTEYAAWLQLITGHLHPLGQIRINDTNECEKSGMNTVPV